MKVVSKRCVSKLLVHPPTIALHANRGPLTMKALQRSSPKQSSTAVCSRKADVRWRVQDSTRTMRGWRCKQRLVWTQTRQSPLSA